MKRLLQKVSRTFRAARPSSHIMMKIWLSTAAVVLAFIILIMIGAQFFFNSYYLDTALERTSKNVLSTAETVSESIDSIIRRFVSVCSVVSFKELMLRIRDADKADYTQLNNDLQDKLYELSTCSSLVSSVIITSKQGLYYHLLAQQLSGSVSSFTLGYDPAEINGITFLPVGDSPVKGQSQVIPMAIPLAFLSGNSLLMVAPTAASSNAILYLFLDAGALNKVLAQYREGKSDTEYLLNSAGSVLNVSAYDDAFNQAVQSGAFDLTSASESGRSTIYDDAFDQAMQSGTFDLTSVFGSGYGTIQSYRIDDRWVLFTRLGRRNMFLAVLVSKSTLLSPLTKLTNTLLIACGASVLIAVLVSLFSAIFLSAPLRRLTAAVKTISDGTYTSDSMLRQRDEIGQLSEAIDTMYHTIQNQIKQIYEERRAKYNAEVRLFTEQVNPHFLYNTLEFINLEVYNGHTENASRMIQSLGSFLHIGLSFGREQITLEKELEHVQAYIAIMNHRFSHHICFTTSIPDELRTRRVLKIILQPLVENSICHGFLLEDNNFFIDTPSIFIKCYRENEKLVLSVIDNGIGFNAKRVAEIMRHSPDPQEHLGLNNVYTRLRLFYGDETEIGLQSIPYYRNTVSVYIPYRYSDADDAD